MRIPKHWARASEQDRTCLGWSDRSLADAERLAHERLAKLLALGDAPAGSGWDYYPAAPLKEEILETPALAGVSALVTRNGPGVQVLNNDRVAFVDVDVGARTTYFLGSLGAFLGKQRRREEAQSAEALERARAWAEKERARLRAYRTAGGLRLLRMDAVLDPAGDECARMFTELGADPQYARLCRIQESFRARLTPKPRRIDCAEAPYSHPRTEPGSRAAFERWLEGYERACQGRAVCEWLGEFGSAPAVGPALAIAALHDRRTLLAEGTLA